MARKEPNVVPFRAGSVPGEDAVEVQDAIDAADAVLPGEPVDEGSDPRWQAIIKVGEFIESEPEPVWRFICRWVGIPRKIYETPSPPVCLNTCWSTTSTSTSPRWSRSPWPTRCSGTRS